MVNWIISLLFVLPPLAQAQEHFVKRKIVLAGRTLTVEIADSEAKREQGLMGRTYLSDDQGMLFEFDRPRILTFWMKNTLLDLSIGFFDERRRLINIIEMRKPLLGEPDFRLPLYKSRKPAKYALEMQAGWFSRHKIAVNKTPVQFFYK